MLTSVRGRPERDTLIRRPEDRERLPAQVDGAIGDLNRPDTLSEALEGVRAVHLIAGYDRLAELLAELRRAGVERVVLQSGNIFRKLDIGEAPAYHRRVVAVLTFLRAGGGA